MISPGCLLASSGFNFTGEWDCRTSCNQSRRFQCGDVIFIDESNSSFILLTIILFALARHPRRQKVSFYANSLCFCCSNGSIQRALTQAIHRYHFFLWPPPCSSCFSLILDRREDAPWLPDKRAGTNDQGLSSVERECVSNNNNT